MLIGGSFGLLWGGLLSDGCTGSEKTGIACPAGKTLLVKMHLALCSSWMHHQTRQKALMRHAELIFVFTVSVLPQSNQGSLNGFQWAQKVRVFAYARGLSADTVTWFRLSGAVLFPEPIDMYDNQCRDLVMGSQRWLCSFYCVSVWLQPKGEATPFVSIKYEEMIQSVLFKL